MQRAFGIMLRPSLSPLVLTPEERSAWRQLLTSNLDGHQPHGHHALHHVTSPLSGEPHGWGWAVKWHLCPRAATPWGCYSLRNRKTKRGKGKNPQKSCARSSLFPQRCLALCGGFRGVNTSCLRLPPRRRCWGEHTAEEQSEAAPCTGKAARGGRRPQHGRAAHLPRGHHPRGWGEAAVGGGHRWQLPAAGQREHPGSLLPLCAVSAAGPVPSSAIASAGCRAAGLGAGCREGLLRW